MSTRIHSAVQLCVALVCTLGAGFSGDLYSHHSGPSSHHGTRHARGSQHRGSRSVSRNGYEDHSADVEILNTERGSPAPGADAAHAALPAVAASITPRWTLLEIIAPVSSAKFRSTSYSRWSPRGPPALI
ncbi:MAG: hypothetical protein WDO18_11215 [Acidobacteriota bacterium]